MAIRTEGAFIEITLPNGKYSYGRILPNAGYAFYNIYSDKKVSELEFIKNSRVLFIVAVYKHAISKNRWTKIGKADLEEGLKKMPLKFIQDALEPTSFSIYDPNTGEIKPASKTDCIGLECAAVWEPEHVEDRIIDHFEKRPNKWVESLKIKD